MKALQLQDYSGPQALQLAEVATPSIGPGELLLDVHAIGINFPDLLLTQGKYQHKPELPFVPGCEVAGVVRSAPADSRWNPGDRCAAFVWQGGYAEQVPVPLNAIVPVPDAVTLETAAAMVVNYQTVHFGLARRGRLKAGETLLVLGAGGGIGTAAVGVGSGLGARVIAGVADEQQRTTAVAAGATDVIVLDEDFSATVRELTDGRGVDVVLDPLGDWLFSEAVRALAPEGRILVIGFAAGAIPEIKVNRLLLRNIEAVGVAYGAFLDIDRELMVRTGLALNAMLESGHLRPRIGARYAFDEIPAALDALSRGQIRGKAVATLNGDAAAAQPTG